MKHCRRSLELPLPISQGAAELFPEVDKHVKPNLGNLGFRLYPEAPGPKVVPFWGSYLES